MGRTLRRHEPGQYYLITTRCHQARFFLRPEPTINDAILQWLARAQRAFPDIRLHAVCAMSNHLHLVVHDQKGELAGWASYFFGNLARAVNRIRKRSGTFYERRYAAESILDDEALVDRVAYVVTNPVKAALCKRAQEWPGVVLWADEGIPVEHHVEWVNRRGKRRSKPGETPPTVVGRVRIDPLPEIGEGSRVEDAIRAREQAHAAEREAQHRRLLTRMQLLRQSWHAAPRDPKRTPRPLCHASDPGLRRAFIEGFRAFTAHFRDASERLRSGARLTPFPDWSYPPGQALFRPGVTASP